MATHMTAAQTWADGLVVCTSGLSRTLRDAVSGIVTAAGGRYTPNLTRDVTHLLLDQYNSAHASAKLSAIQSNREAWGQHVVWVSWLAACEEQHRLLSTDAYIALPPVPNAAGLSNSQNRQPLPSTPASCSASASLAGSSLQSAASSQQQGQWHSEHNETAGAMQPQMLFQCPEMLVTHKPWLLNMSQQADIEPQCAIQDQAAPWRLGLESLQEAPPAHSIWEGDLETTSEHVSPVSSPVGVSVLPLLPALKVEQPASPVGVAGAMADMRPAPTWALSPAPCMSRSRQQAGLMSEHFTHALQSPAVPTALQQTSGLLLAVAPLPSHSATQISAQLKTTQVPGCLPMPFHSNHTSTGYTDTHAPSRSSVKPPTSPAQAAELVDKLLLCRRQQAASLQMPPPMASTAQAMAVTACGKAATPTATTQIMPAISQHTDSALQQAAAACRTAVQHSAAGFYKAVNSPAQPLSQFSKRDSQPRMAEPYAQPRIHHGTDHAAIMQAAATPLPASQHVDDTSCVGGSPYKPQVRLSSPAAVSLSGVEEQGADLPQDLMPVHDLISQLAALHQHQLQHHALQPAAQAERQMQVQLDKQQTELLQSDQLLPSAVGTALLGSGPRSRRPCLPTEPASNTCNQQPSATGSQRPFHSVTMHNRGEASPGRGSLSLLHAQQRHSVDCCSSEVAVQLLPKGGPVVGLRMPQACLQLPDPSPLKAHHKQTAGLLPVDSLVQQLQQQQQQQGANHGLQHPASAGTADSCCAEQRRSMQHRSVPGALQDVTNCAGRLDLVHSCQQHCKAASANGSRSAAQYCQGETESSAKHMAKLSVPDLAHHISCAELALSNVHYMCAVPAGIQQSHPTTLNAETGLQQSVTQPCSARGLALQHVVLEMLATQSTGTASSLDVCISQTLGEQKQNKSGCISQTPGQPMQDKTINPRGCHSKASPSTEDKRSAAASAKPATAGHAADLCNARASQGLVCRGAIDAGIDAMDVDMQHDGPSAQHGSEVHTSAMCLNSVALAPPPPQQQQQPQVSPAQTSAGAASAPAHATAPGMESVQAAHHAADGLDNEGSFEEEHQRHTPTCRTQGALGHNLHDAPQTSCVLATEQDAAAGGHNTAQGKASVPLLHNMVAMLDPSLTYDQKHTARHQLQALGAQICGDVNHDQQQQQGQPSCVICDAQAANAWLSRGTHLLSVDWLAWASRCLPVGTACHEHGTKHLSTDILHALHTKLLSSKTSDRQCHDRHVRTQQEQAAQSAVQCPDDPTPASNARLPVSADVHVQLCSDSGEVDLTTAKARQKVLMRIKEQEKKAATALKPVAGCRDYAPSQLLADLQWSVKQQPCEATLEQHMSDTGEALHQVVYKGSQLIILLPMNQSSCSTKLGHHALQLSAPPAGITVLTVLQAVHDYYQQQLSFKEQARLMAAAPVLRRMLQEPFLHGSSVTRAALLGPQTGWDCLNRYAASMPSANWQWYREQGLLLTVDLQASIPYRAACSTLGRMYPR